MPPFRCEDIDHSLVNLKLADSAEDVNRKTKEDEARIQFENLNNLNSNAVPSLVLRMKQESADARAQQVYEIYCDVWRTQGHVKSAAFVRAVCARGVVPTIRARAGAIAGKLVRFAKRTSFPEAIRDAHLLAHGLKMQRLQSRWERRLEAEAKVCEYAERIERLRPECLRSIRPQPNPVRKLLGMGLPTRSGAKPLSRRSKTRRATRSFRLKNQPSISESCPAPSTDGPMRAN
jgi:hypothetical protein